MPTQTTIGVLLVNSDDAELKQWRFALKEVYRDRVMVFEASADREAATIFKNSPEVELRLLFKRTPEGMDSGRRFRRFRDLVGNPPDRTVLGICAADIPEVIVQNGVECWPIKYNLCILRLVQLVEALLAAKQLGGQS
ncbi:MAG: hypothetical protein V1821_00525 [bacterium]